MSKDKFKKLFHLAKIRETAAHYNMTVAKTELEEERKDLRIAQESLEDVKIESVKKIDNFLAETPEDSCALTRMTKMRAMIAAARFDQQQLQDYIEQKNKDIVFAEQRLNTAVEHYRVLHKRLEKLSPVEEKINLETVKEKEICLDGEHSQ